MFPLHMAAALKGLDAPVGTVRSLGSPFLLPYIFIGGREVLTEHTWKHSFIALPPPPISVPAARDLPQASAVSQEAEHGGMSLRSESSLQGCAEPSAASSLPIPPLATPLPQSCLFVPGPSRHFDSSSKNKMPQIVDWEPKCWVALGPN